MWTMPESCVLCCSLLACIDFLWLLADCEYIRALCLDDDDLGTAGQLLIQFVTC